MKYLLDTHVWIWWNMNPSKLSKKVISILTNSDKYEKLYLSIISVWEFCKLIEKKRLIISCDTQEWIDNALQMQKLKLMHLTPGILLKSTTLPQPFHNDPADQIIVATARQKQVPIISKDTRMLNYHHAEIIW